MTGALCIDNVIYSSNRTSRASSLVRCSGHRPFMLARSNEPSFICRYDRGRRCEVSGHRETRDPAGLLSHVLTSFSLADWTWGGRARRSAVQYSVMKLTYAVHYSVLMLSSWRGLSPGRDRLTWRLRERRQCVPYVGAGHSLAGTRLSWGCLIQPIVPYEGIDTDSRLSDRSWRLDGLDRASYNMRSTNVIQKNAYECQLPQNAYYHSA